MEYNFYYDESEHSRQINYKTITVDNYYDNFLTVIVGWDSKKECELKKKYELFEKKYSERKNKNAELKSDTFKNNQFEYGLSSFNTQNIELLNDFISIFDDDIIIYFSSLSKMEYIVNQLFEDYSNNIFFDMDALKYSIIKVLLTYHPDDVLNCIYNEPDKLVDTLIKFLQIRIEYNKKNITLKSQENQAFEQAIILLMNVKSDFNIKWNYRTVFVGFKKYLTDLQITKYSLVLDKEGGNQNTLCSAKELGLQEVSELDSKQHFGIRMADMLVGLIGKIMKSLYKSLHQESANILVEKNLLDKKWFNLNMQQLSLYKKLYHIMIETNKAWNKIYSGNYSDDLITFISLLGYMNNFNDIDEIKKNFDMLPEYCNAYMCANLLNHFERMYNKLPVEPMVPETKEYFRNDRGAKVYFDINKQPVLYIPEGKTKYNVQSVGFDQNLNPLITIKTNNEFICYRLPEEFFDWAITRVAIANKGVNVFPSFVVFSRIKGKYSVDIL